MKLEIEINNQKKSSFSKDYFKKVISKTIELSGIKFSGKMDMSLAIVSSQEIKKINRIFRKKDEVTDILSFSDYTKRKTQKNDFFCELIVCLPYIKKSSKEDNVSLKKELAYVISHGMLHCIGYTHSKKMYAIQDEVCQKF